MYTLQAWSLSLRKASIYKCKRRVRRKKWNLLRIFKLGSEGIKTQKCVFVLTNAWLNILYKIDSKKNPNCFLLIIQVLNFYSFCIYTIWIVYDCIKVSAETTCFNIEYLFYIYVLYRIFSLRTKFVILLRVVNLWILPDVLKSLMRE